MMNAMKMRVKFDDGASTTLEGWGGSGPAVLCVHGITSSRKAWERTALALRDSYQVYAYDQRGHGDSASVAGPMTLERSLADLRSVASAIDQPVAIIGHSWGGAVALLGGHEPTAFKVVAIDPMVRVKPLTWKQDYLDDAVADFALPHAQREAAFRRRLAAWHGSDIAGKLHAIKEMQSETIARLGSENRVDEGGWDLRSVVAGYPKPLLILAAGPADSVMSSEDLAFIRSQGGSNVTIETFADQGHNLHRTAFDRYIDSVRQFLAA